MFPYRQAVEDYRRQIGRSKLLLQTHGIELSTGITAIVLWLMLVSH